MRMTDDLDARIASFIERICWAAGYPARTIRNLFGGICAEVREDIRAVRERDPAARNDWEILLLYSGVHALLFYRVAHALQQKKAYFAARAVSQMAKQLTGIEIHPASKIGHGLFIDHGMGVVIGETAEIGDGCTLYQGVTLGGTGKDVGKRHPTLEDRVMVGCGAKILGPIVIGHDSKIAANAVVLKDVPPFSTAVGIPAKVVRQAGVRTTPSECSLDQIHIPDPVAGQMRAMEEEINRLRERLDRAEANQNRKEE